VTIQSSLVARVDAVVDGALAAKRLVGAVVSIAQGGALAYRRAAGFADREAGRAMREDDVFRLASVTKPFVAAAAMRLVEQGAIALDHPATRYLPDFRPRLASGEAPPLSIHRLLTHTAGLGYGSQEGADGPYHRLGVSSGLDQPGLSLEENLRRLAAAPLVGAPGAAWRYSLAMDVLGAILAKASGQSLPALLRRLVLDPLGLRDSGFEVPDRARLVAPYRDGAPEPIRMDDDACAVRFGDALILFAPRRALDPTSYPSGGAGMVGTAPDVLKLLEAIRGGGAPILEPETVARMTADQVGTQAETQGPGWGFGYGWATLVDPVAAATPQSKGTFQWGGVYGHNWFVDPAKALSVVALTNTAVEGMAGAFVAQLRDAVYG
jgi:CubicO group peptidase (beta-lactamase class C family)